MGLAVKARGLARQVLGYSRRPETAAAALALGCVDAVSDDLHTALQRADIVYLAAPVAQMPALFEAIDRAGNHRQLILDAGSTKANLVAAARAVAARSAGGLAPWFSQFVPSHPIAGAEKHGPGAAFADLYTGRTVVLCPHEHTSDPALHQATAFWRALDMRVLHMAADEHDRVFAAVSHLPHWIAYAYVHALLQSPTGRADMQEGGGGFRDFSRIAGSSAEMWVDIFQENRGALLAQLDGFQRSLNDMRDALSRGDRAALTDMVQSAAAFRKAWTGR